MQPDLGGWPQQRAVQRREHFENLDAALETWGIQSVGIMDPHADDESVAMGSTIATLTHRGVQVHVFLLYAGYRGLGFDNELDQEAITARRLQELSDACEELGAQVHPILVSAYDRPDQNYLPTLDDIHAVAEALSRKASQVEVLFAPTLNHDRHVAHQAAFELTVAAAVFAGLKDLPLFSFESPWGCPDPTHFLAYSRETERTKLRAIGRFGSQLRYTDYRRWAKHRGRAWRIVLPELCSAHSRPAEDGWLDKIGAEVFRHEGLVWDHVARLKLDTLPEVSARLGRGAS